MAEAKPTAAVVVVDNQQPVAVVANDPIADGWAKARRYVEAATLFQRASLASQIMAGFVLLDLRKAFPENRGGNHKNQKTHDAVFEFWQDAVKGHLGISDDTAYRWMDMARSAKPRLNKGDIDLSKILEKNPGALTQAEQELLKKAVHKISDGRTQMEFMLECGVTKAPHGSEAKGGNLDGAGKKAHVLTQTPDVVAEKIRERMEERCNLLNEDLIDKPWIPASPEMKKTLPRPTDRPRGRSQRKHDIMIAMVTSIMMSDIRYGKLPPAAQRDVDARVALCLRIDQADNKKRAAKKEALRSHAGRTILNLHRDRWLSKNRDWYALVDRARWPEKKEEVTPEFVEFWHQLCHRFKGERRHAAAHRALERLWHAGDAVPGVADLAPDGRAGVLPDERHYQV